MFFYWLETDIKLEILNKLAHLNQLETQINVTSELFFFSRFFSWPRNYYNDNKKGQNLCKMPFAQEPKEV